MAKEHLASRYVQRIQKIFDGIELDYMGSAEFEWGSVQCSLAVLRHMPYEEREVPDVLFRNGETMSSLVPKDYADKAMQSIHDTILASHHKLSHHFKEVTLMDCLLSLGEVKPRDPSYKIYTVAWLSVDPFTSTMLSKETNMNKLAREHVQDMSEEEDWPKYTWFLCRTADLDDMKKRYGL